MVCSNQSIYRLLKDMEKELDVKLVDSNKSYKKDVAKHFAKNRLETNQLKLESAQQLRNIQQEHGIEPKPKATYDDINKLIGMVLNTGNTGTKVLKEYAKENSKDDDWKKAISRQIIRDKVRSMFKQVLLSYQDHPVIIRMKGNKMYNEKQILNNSLTGALSELSKQLALSDAKDADKNEKVILKELLEVKKDTLFKNKTDWNKVQTYRDKGLAVRNKRLTVRVIANTFGVSPSAVSKYTKKLISVI